MNETPQVEQVHQAPGSSTSRVGAGLFVAVLFLAGIGGVAFWRWKQAREAPAPAAPAPVVQAPAAPRAPPVSLADGDALLRQLGAELSSGKELPTWLAEGDILRRMTAAVSLIAEGKSPRPVLGFLSPPGAFQVVTRGQRLYASPGSYARYNLVTRVLTSIDPAAAGKAYGQLRPYFNAAFAEIGPPGKSFDGALHEAIKRISGTPLPTTEPEVQPLGLGYVYADPGIEGLSPAQKNLLRMGPDNGRAVQGWLQKLEQALPPAP